MENEEKKEEKIKEEREQSSKSTHKTAQMRSQSVTQKDIRSSIKIGKSIITQVCPSEALPAPKDPASRRGTT